METNNLNAAEESEEDSWDAIDIDARIESDTKVKQQEELDRLKALKIKQEKKTADDLKVRERERKVEANRRKQEEKIRETQLRKALAEGFQPEDNGNYFEANQKKKALAVATGKSTKQSRDMQQDEDDYQQPYPSKILYDLQSFTKSSENFHKLIYQTYGNLERFLVTHDAPDLIPKKLIALLMIDVALLEVPFHSHNDLLLSEISKIDTYWSQVIDFLKDFFERKHKEAAFLLNVDMDSFFFNLERIFHDLMLNNHFNEKMKAVLEKLTVVLDKFDGHEWMVAHGFSAARFKKLQADFEKNANLHKVYDVSNCFILPWLLTNKVYFKDLSNAGRADLQRLPSFGRKPHFGRIRKRLRLPPSPAPFVKGRLHLQVARSCACAAGQWC